MGVGSEALRNQVKRIDGVPKRRLRNDEPLRSGVEVLREEAIHEGEGLAEAGSSEVQEAVGKLLNANNPF